MSLIGEMHEARSARLLRLGAMPSHRWGIFQRELESKNLVIGQQAAAIDLLKEEIAALKKGIVVDREPVRPLVSRKIMMEDIIAATGRHYDVRHNEIVGQGRCAEYVRARQVVSYLSKLLTTLSLTFIGNRLGRRDHTTILHAARKISALVAAGGSVADDVAAIRAALGVAS